ncbi:MAG: aldehyde ferredoxin oxidoreductase C-terminal domain-containing protein [Melioribacteraceae bacterium]|nr:aldehyde ferredoxin oxidoreductase C-terminal domain-containing protein [Melioribacteraceae bacterium]
MEVNEILKDRKLVKEFRYEIFPMVKGYSDKTIYINLTDNQIRIKDVPLEMKEKFIGGKGYGLRYLWDATTPETKWDDPENEIIISGGPVCGITQYSGTGKSLVVTISPQTDSVMDSNVGGWFGPFLKLNGFDAIELQGKAERDVIIILDGRDGTGKIRIEEAPADPINSHHLADTLTEMYSTTEQDKMKIAVVSAGAAADHSLIGMLNFSFYDKRKKRSRLKQAGRGGIGTVFRNKKIKALVALVAKVENDMNHVVDMKAIIERGQRFNKEMKELDESQCEMRTKGTAHLVEVMNDYDLLPVNNFKFGSNEAVVGNIDGNTWKKQFEQGSFDGCWLGCNMSCAKGVNNYILRTGPFKGENVIVDGPEYETAAGIAANSGIFSTDYTIEVNFYCDTYGVCTITWGTTVAFLMECYENGILNLERTGGMKLNFGNADNAMELLHQLGRGEGFGLTAGLGVRRLKKLFKENGWGNPQFLQDIGMENKGLEYSQYMSKESLAQQGGYAMTNKGPQHDEAWLIFMDMVNNHIPTFEDKAEALHYFPLFRTWFGLAGFCKLPWNDVEPKNNAETSEPAKVPEHVDNYVTIYKAVTGRPFDSKRLIEDSERVYNFQRMFNLRRGYGVRKWDAQPYRAAGPVTEEEYLSRQERYDAQLKDIIGINPEGMTIKEKMAAHRKYRENRYEQLLDAVYERRGWDKNGVPKIELLKKLGMDLPELIELRTKYEKGEWHLK